MTSILFGKGDVFAIPKPGNMPNAPVPDTFYTHPTLDRYYSPHGFAYPLDGQGVPLDILLENKMPLKLATIDPVKLDYQFILVDLQGNLWKILVIHGNDGKLVTSSHAITAPMDSWWITTKSEDRPIPSDISVLTGFLYTQPPIDKINKFWFTYMMTGQLQWLSISQIVEDLRVKFLEIPVSQKKEMIS